MWTPMKYHLYTMEAKKNRIKVSLHFLITITIVAVDDLMIFMSFV